MLNPSNPNHLWLLHALFLDMINDNCQRFQDEWNCHPISGPNTNNKSPCMCHGIYHDDCEGIHPDLIHEFYGMEGTPLQYSKGKSGAGNPIDEETVHIPTLKSPFTDRNEAQSYYIQKILPSDFRLMPAKWKTDHYPVFEFIHIKWRGSKQLDISLADSI
ncbi:hypothetical protein HD554DRAFT_2066360 [Boletus coccyginus]|nr:hypothetical protein HD554DRAFT_2066360 [Boletus coccyginus]